MARIAGVNLPVQKHVWVALTHIYGIGRSRALEICSATGIAPETKVRDLTEGEQEKLRQAIDHIRVEGDLRREVSMSIKRLMDLGCYRGQIGRASCREREYRYGDDCSFDERKGEQQTW